MSNSCRLCLSNDDFKTSLFGTYCQRNKLLDKIIVCLRVKISESDEQQHICYKCVNSIETFYSFINKVNNTQKKLQENMCERKTKIPKTKEFDKESWISPISNVTINKKNGIKKSFHEENAAELDFFLLDVLDAPEDDGKNNSLIQWKQKPQSPNFSFFSDYQSLKKEEIPIETRRNNRRLSPEQSDDSSDNKISQVFCGRNDRSNKGRQHIMNTRKGKTGGDTIFNIQRKSFTPSSKLEHEKFEIIAQAKARPVFGNRNWSHTSKVSNHSKMFSDDDIHPNETKPQQYSKDLFDTQSQETSNDNNNNNYNTLDWQLTPDEDVIRRVRKSFDQSIF